MSASASAAKPALPPDPEGLNDTRATWARAAIDRFAILTNADDEDLVADLICNLRHYCDREGIDFERELARGWEMYETETTP